MIQQVKCPICRQRLFDIEERATGLIAIKCTKCRQVSKIKLEKKSVIISKKS